MICITSVSKQLNLSLPKQYLEVYIPQNHDNASDRFSSLEYRYSRHKKFSSFIESFITKNLSIIEKIIIIGPLLKPIIIIIKV